MIQYRLVLTRRQGKSVCGIGRFGSVRLAQAGVWHGGTEAWIRSEDDTFSLLVSAARPVLVFVL